MFVACHGVHVSFKTELNRFRIMKFHICKFSIYSFLNKSAKLFRTKIWIFIKFDLPRLSKVFLFEHTVITAEYIKRNDFYFHGCIQFCFQLMKMCIQKLVLVNKQTFSDTLVTASCC